MSHTSKKVREFNVAFNLPHDLPPQMHGLDEYDREVLRSVSTTLLATAQRLLALYGSTRVVPLLRLQLMLEELAEVGQEMADGSLEGMLKELSDLQYVVDGTYIAYGIERGQEAAFEEVHWSNMTKLGEDKKPVFCPHGKVTKGPNYQPANMEGLVNGYSHHRTRSRNLARIQIPGPNRRRSLLGKRSIFQS